MASLEYSNDALSSKGRFYNKEIIVFVEGKDDILFWDSLFNIAEVKAHIEDVGGSEELKKYFDKILKEEADFYLATDNDNSEFKNDMVDHKRILRTYGYSIENSMYYYKNPIEKEVSGFCRKKLDLSNDFKIWLNEFSEKLYDLIVYDIANNRFGRGLSIFGDNCCRFLYTPKSYKLCKVKLQQYIDLVKVSFTEDEINEVKEMINQSEKDLWFMIKGHFITHSLINLIKYSVKKHGGDSISYTPGNLYNLTFNCTENWENRIDIKMIVERIKALGH